MKEISICCVGWEKEGLTLEAAGHIEAADAVILRTERCGLGSYLRERGIDFQALDSLYDRCEDFDQLDDMIEEAVVSAAEDKRVYYATPTLSDRAAARILRKYPEARGDVALYALSPCQTVTASDWERLEPNARQDAVVYEITDALLASEVKLRLMESYGDEAPVYFRRPGGGIERTVLSDLDRMGEYDHRCAAVICGGEEYSRRNVLDLHDLMDVMALLRDKCPWDGQQTHESLKKYLLEEAYETIDAIDRDSDPDMCEELGDVLFQVAFHAQIAKEHGAYGMRDVVDGICRKMIRRHVHVFGGVKAETAEEVARLWQQVKRQEKKERTPSEAIRDLPVYLPSLMLAQKAIKRAREYGLPLPGSREPDTARILDALSSADTDAETALHGAIVNWMQRIQTESDLDHTSS